MIKFLPFFLIFLFVGCIDTKENSGVKKKYKNDIQNPKVRTAWRTKLKNELKNYEENEKINIEYLKKGKVTSALDKNDLIDIFSKTPHIQNLHFSNYKKDKAYDLSSVSKFKELKWLHIFCNSSKKLDIDFSKLKSLETLIINCDALEKLPLSINKLSSLKHLFIASGKINNLNEIVFDFPNLIYIYITNMESDDSFIHPSIGTLKNLKKLVIGRMGSQLPNSIDSLVMLEELTIKPQPFDVPFDFSNFKNLKHLELGPLNKNEIVLSEENQSLIELTIHDGNYFPKGIHLLPNLKILNLNHMDFKMFENEFKPLKNIIQCNINWCHQLTTIPPLFADFNNLLEINLNSNGSIEAISDSLLNSESLKFINHKNEHNLVISDELQNNPYFFFTDSKKYSNN